MAQGKGKNKSEPTHALVDLVGLPGTSLQSEGQFVTQRDLGGNLQIAGNSHWYLETGGPAHKYPVLWQINDQGDMDPDDPVNLGIPARSKGIRLQGMNQHGVMVSTTESAIEKDEDGNWIFPSYVKIPGQPYQEMPYPLGANHYPHLEDINDSGQILGSYEITVSTDPKIDVAFSALWQVELDGSISGPFPIDDSSDGQYFQPTSINNAGIMAGPLQGYPAIAWFEDGTLQTVVLDSSLQFYGAEIKAMNDNDIFDEQLTLVGQVRADANGDFSAPDRGFAWRPFAVQNPTTEIGTFGGRSSSALGVNDAGHFVGWADTKKNGAQAFLYSDGEMKNLNSLVDAGNKTLQQANAINDSGDITGFMRIPRPVSESHGFLVRPIEQ